MVHFMFITLLPSYVPPMYSYVTNVFVCNLYFTIGVCMYPYVSRMLLVCTLILLICTRMLLVRYSYATRMSLVYTRMYPYVTRMYSCGVLVTIVFLFGVHHSQTNLNCWINLIITVKKITPVFSRLRTNPLNHKNYNFLDCVCYRTVHQANHIQSCSLNQPISISE